jgi:hypothetical protein
MFERLQFLDGLAGDVATAVHVTPVDRLEQPIGDLGPAAQIGEGDVEFASRTSRRGNRDA